MFNVVSLKFIPGQDQGEAEIEAAGGRLVRTLCRTGPESDEAEILAAVAEADAVLTMLQPFTRRVIESSPRLRAICVTGIGYDWIDVGAATERGVLVTNVPDYCLDEVADHALMLLLACARKLLPLHRAIQRGLWDAPMPLDIRQKVLPPMFRLRGQTLGLIGFGNIARNLTPKAQALGLRVMAADPYLTGDQARKMGVTLVDLDGLLAQADYVSLHASLSEASRHMIGARELNLMKPTAFLINTARGPLVDEPALVEALRQGRIAGAGLDVLETEPPASDNPLLEMDNVIITPHTAQYSQEAEVEGWRRPGQEAARILSGQWPRPVALVNPAAKAEYVRRWGAMRD